ncbi:acyloxyacyl hydrolase [Sphingobacterium yanglingense]|uniref:Lipid A 3-O-deacylase PagL n=1 Tax=Sphingobacterium yanglingense TaxID=1437280 RepID=A0A4R6WEF3_9SPHI|nr:acyloxyacyl hydrolase [Sphingobacterium yanglingense]TDQ78179.1 lipid A 3-O-deacylase PagL [Sphingobacterium yanglingense]
MKTKFILLLLGVSLQIGFTRASTDTLTNTHIKNSLILEAEIENGGILATGELKNTTFKDAYYNAFNLKVGWKMNTKSDKYFKLYNNPIYGIGFYSSTFNNDIVGSPYAIYGFVQTPFGNIDNEKWSFDYRIGLGLSGNFKPYDEDKNPLNLAIATKNNVYIDFGIRTQYRLSSKFKAGLGLAFHHFSNGALKLPNKGVNLVPVTASITYQPDGRTYKKDTTSIESYPDNIFYHINFGAGLKQVARDMDRKFLKTTLSLYASKHVSQKWRLGGGMDIFYSASGNNEEIAEDKTGKLSAKLSGGPAFYLVHVLNKDLVLNGNVGYYIHNQYFNGEIKRVFLRAGVRYYVYKNLNAGISIKAHTGKADFIEWTLGYTFNR